MIDKKDFSRVKSGIVDATNSNYQELLGFLQRFYAVNVVREIGSLDDSIKGEVNSLVRKSLVELYNSDSSKKYINGLVNTDDEDLRMRVTTMALFEEVFPEFIDGSFNPSGVKSEEREIASMVISSTEAYKNTSPRFKEALSKAMARPVDRSHYDRVAISPELTELIYEDYSPKQR